MKKSWQTTAGGVTAAIGTILAILVPKLLERIGMPVSDAEAMQIVGAAVTVIGLVWVGKAARDDGVTSEGRDARSYRPKSGALITLTLIPACMVGMGGCAGGSGQSYRVATTLYTGSVEIATDALASGTIDVDQAERFESARANARMLLDTWGTLEMQGRGEEFDQLERLEALIDMMIQLQEANDGGSSHSWVREGGDPGGADGRRAGGSRAGRGQDHARGVRFDPGGDGRGGLGLGRAA